MPPSGATLSDSDAAVVSFSSEFVPTCSAKTLSASRTAALLPTSSSALQMIGSRPGRPACVSGVPFAQPAAGSGTPVPPRPMTSELCVTTGATPLQDFDVLDDFATCAIVPVLVATFAVLAAPPEDWQAPAWPATPWLSAAPTPRPSNPARATAKSFVELVPVVSECMRSTVRQTCWLVFVHSGSRMLACRLCSGPSFVSPRRRVDGDHVVAEQADRRDVAVVRAVGVALAAGAADDDVLAGVTAIGIGGQRAIGARVDVDAGDRALTVRVRAVRRRLYRRIGGRRACLGVLGGRLLEARLRLPDEGGSLLTGLLNGALQPGLQLLARLHKGFARASKVARAERSGRQGEDDYAADAERKCPECLTGHAFPSHC